MKKILALGYVPKWKGGLQKTGLATGLFDLHDSVNSLHSDYQVVLAATDIFSKEVVIDNTKVLGWSKLTLLLHALLYFYRLPFFIREALRMTKYKPAVKFPLLLAKILFLDYAISREKPDIIHLHGCIYAMFRTAIWDRKKKVVLRLHGINGFDSSIPHYEQYRRMEKYITSLPFDFVTFVTGGICEEWKEKYGKFTCKMIPLVNGFNANVFYLPSSKIDKQFDLVTFSGLQERKGQDRVIKALKRLADEGKSLSYLVIGSGDATYEQYIHGLAKEYALNVTFLPYVSQDKIVSYLWKCKFFILPSITEGFGKVYVESAGAGIPVILPKTLPIVKENGVIVKDNAILIADESVESIYQGIKKLDTYTFEEKMVAKTVEHLKWQSLAKSYISLYKHIS